MRNSWRTGKIRCPYFRHEDKNRHVIKCEGLGDAVSMSWNFTGEDERQRIRQMEVFCQGCFEKCEMYRMIEQSKYDTAGGE